MVHPHSRHVGAGVADGVGVTVGVGVGVTDIDLHTPPTRTKALAAFHAPATRTNALALFHDPETFVCIGIVGQAVYCSQTSPSAPPDGADVLIVMFRADPAGLAPLFTTSVPGTDTVPFANA